MRKIICLLCFCILLFNSCIGGFGFIFKKHLFGNYYLIATDDIEDCCLSHHKETDENNWGEVIEPTVFAVGFNSHYLIAKQYYHPFYDTDTPLSSSYSTYEVIRPDKNNIRYYILPIKEDMNWRTLNGLLGPLSYDDFEAKRRELGISDIEFSVEIDI